MESTDSSTTTTTTTDETAFFLVRKKDLIFTRVKAFNNDADGVPTLKVPKDGNKPPPVIIIKAKGNKLHWRSGDKQPEIHNVRVNQEGTTYTWTRNRRRRSDSNGKLQKEKVFYILYTAVSPIKVEKFVQIEGEDRSTLYGHEIYEEKNFK